MSNIQPLRPKAPKPPRSRPLRELLGECTKPREAILGEWMREGHLCMVYAPTGVGKSFFAQACGMAAAGAGGAFGWNAPQRRNVLLVDGEMDREDIVDRARLLMAASPGLDTEAVADNFHVMAYQDQEPDTSFPNIAEAAGQECIVERARAVGASLVILDNFSTLAQVEDENAAAAMDPLVELLRRLKRIGCAVILVHHSKKGKDGHDASYRGSSKMGVTFQTIIRLKAPEDAEGSPGVAFVLCFEKSRGLRTAEHQPRRAHLPPPKPGVCPAWAVEADDDPQLLKLVRLVRSREHATQATLAAALVVSTGTLSALKRMAISREMISADDWRTCLLEAKELREDDQAEPQPF